MKFGSSPCDLSPMMHDAECRRSCRSGSSIREHRGDREATRPRRSSARPCSFRRQTGWPLRGIVGVALHRHRRDLHRRRGDLQARGLLLGAPRQVVGAGRDLACRAADVARRIRNGADGLVEPLHGGVEVELDLLGGVGEAVLQPVGEDRRRRGSSAPRPARRPPAPARRARTSRQAAVRRSQALGRALLLGEPALRLGVALEPRLLHRRHRGNYDKRVRHPPDLVAYGRSPAPRHRAARQSSSSMVDTSRNSGVGSAARNRPARTAGRGDDQRDGDQHDRAATVSRPRLLRCSAGRPRP